MTTGEFYVSVFFIFYMLTSSSSQEDFCSSTQHPSFFECLLNVATLDRWPNVIPLNASNLKILLKYNFSLDTVDCLDIKSPFFPNVEKLVIIIVGEPTNISPVTGRKISEFSKYSGDNTIIIATVKLLLSRFPNLSSFSITNKSRTIANFRMPIFHHSIKLESLSISNFRGVLHTSPAFKGTGNLRSLELDNNNIMKLDENTFETCCQHSAYLSLQRNDIETVSHPHRLRGLDGLRTLDMSLNKLTKIENHNFINRMIRLKDLNLSKNRISYISPYAFDGMNFLELLDLSANQLTCVPEFHSSYHLKGLLVHNNMIDLFSTSSVKALIYLEELDLSNNLLQSFNMRVIDILTKLTSIRLSHNEIRQLDFKTSPINFQLENIYLNGNNLVNLSLVISWVKTKVSNVKLLDISENQWINCDVFIKWIFKKNSSSVNLEFNEEVFIDSHQDYSGKWLLHVKMADRFNNFRSIKLLNWNQVSCFKEFFKKYSLEGDRHTSSATTNPSIHSSPLTSLKIKLRQITNTFPFRTSLTLMEKSQHSKSVAVNNRTVTEKNITSTSTSTNMFLSIDDIDPISRYYVIFVIISISTSLIAIIGVLLVKKKQKKGEYDVINENVSTPDLLSLPIPIT